MPQRHIVSDSEFHMWRALFAFAFADNTFSEEEKNLLKAYQADTLFSSAQLATLRDDFAAPKNVADLHHKITDPADKSRFCALARTLLWCDGDPDQQEEAILKKVSCLNEPAGREILRKSRSHPHLHSYYEHYTRDGVLSLLKPDSHFSLQA